MLFIALFVFKLPMVGSLPLVIVMMLLLGLTGMAYGLVISTVATSEVAAMQVGLGTFFPSMMLSGECRASLYALVGTFGYSFFSPRYHLASRRHDVVAEICRLLFTDHVGGRVHAIHNAPRLGD